MKSELERSNSWAPFLESMERILKRRDFRPSTIRSVFRFIDPLFDTEPLGWRNFLLYLIFWNTSEVGRQYRYRRPLSSFMKRKGSIFRNAPLLVIQRYNAFVESLLGKKEATLLLIPEDWARNRRTKKELLLERGRRGFEVLASLSGSLQPVVQTEEEEKSLSLTPWKEESPSEERDVLFVEKRKEAVLKPPYDRFCDLLESQDEEQMEERRRLLEQLLIRKRTLTYQLHQVREEETFSDESSLQQQLDAVDLEGPFFEKGVSEKEAKERIRVLQISLDSIEESLHERWDKYANETMNQALLLGKACVTLTFQLWPFIGYDLVWKDMGDRVDSLREVLLPTVHSLLESTSSKLVQELLYQTLELDDVRALEGELFYRASREKDFVEAACELLQESIFLLVLSLVASLKDQEHLFQNMIERLRNMIVRCMTPTSSFPRLVFRENVAELFRNLWEELEVLRSEFVASKKRVLEAVSLEKQEEYVRRMFLFLSDVERSSLAPIGELYASFQKEEKKPLAQMFAWQKSVLCERIGCTALLLLVAPSERRKRGLEVLVHCQQKEGELRSLAKKILAAVHSDAPFVQYLLWSIKPLLTVLAIHPFSKAGFDGHGGDEMTTLLEQIELSLQLWWSTIPASIKVSDQVLLSKVEDVLPESEDSHEFSRTRRLFLTLLQKGEPTLKGLHIQLLLVLYDLFDQLKAQKSIVARQFLMRISAFLKMMIKELVLKKYDVSSTSYEVLEDILQDMKREFGQDPLTEFNIIFHTLEKIEEISISAKNRRTTSKRITEEPVHSLPLMGDGGFFLKETVNDGSTSLRKFA